MKAYLILTGILFGLLAVLHAWRMMVESPHLAETPWFVLITLVCVALCVWAFQLLRRSPRA